MKRSKQTGQYKIDGEAKIKIMRVTEKEYQLIHDLRRRRLNRLKKEKWLVSIGESECSE